VFGTFFRLCLPFHVLTQLPVAGLLLLLLLLLRWLLLELRQESQGQVPEVFDFSLSRALSSAKSNARVAVVPLLLLLRVLLGAAGFSLACLPGLYRK